MSVSERPLPVHAPMNQFAVAAGQLLVGGITLQRLLPGSARRLFMPMTGSC